MIYCFDLDDTLFNAANKYGEVTPKRDRIAEVNRLYDEGHTIKLYTARGSETGENHTALTLDQIRWFGVKHHKLIMGKPHADIYVDDKGISDLEFFRATDSEARLVQSIEMSNKAFT